MQQETNNFYSAEDYLTDAEFIYAILNFEVSLTKTFMWLNVKFSFKFCELFTGANFLSEYMLTLFVD